MKAHGVLNYAEFAARDLAATRKFFELTFQWQFTDYGPDYMAFVDGSLDGGFYRADLSSRSDSGAALLVFYSSDLESIRDAVLANGGAMLKDIYPFPGGRRFHFLEPSGNEFAVWSE